MKRLLLLFYFIGLFIISRAQLTERPVVGQTNAVGEHYAYIQKVLVTPDITEIYVKNPGFSWGTWVRFNPKTWIEYNDPQTGVLQKRQILCLKDFVGDTLSLGAKYWYKKTRYDTFRLVFPSLPKGVNKINFIEKDGWYWYGIQLSEEVAQIATTEEEINKLISNSKNSFAGIYEQMNTTSSTPSGYNLAFVQNDEGTFLVYVGSTYSVGTWKYGEVKAVLRQAASKSVYKGEWYMSDKTKRPTYITFEGATMKVHVDDGRKDNDVIYVKMSGGVQYDDPNIYSEEWSGTGFALKNGYIMTNYHVIYEATTINIYGIDGDFTNGVKATVIGSDKTNDLALLKISGKVPAIFNSIPYGFKSMISDVGEEIYVLGYPLTATMGEEVKLTNGIISSRTGFDGDVSQYQISAPVQPGNSGGPLFDYNGNVIGVICAKHKGAENVSYAVKTSQIRNLIESISDLSIIKTTNTLQGKSLKDQVKSVNKYVYLIKCRK